MNLRKDHFRKFIFQKIYLSILCMTVFCILCVFNDIHEHFFFKHQKKNNILFFFYESGKKPLKKHYTLCNGSLGSRIDEERREMRYVMRIAELCESSNLWTHLALDRFIYWACLFEGLHIFVDTAWVFFFSYHKEKITWNTLLYEERKEILMFSFFLCLSLYLCLILGIFVLVHEY